MFGVQRLKPQYIGSFLQRLKSSPSQSDCQLGPAISTWVLVFHVRGKHINEGL